MKRLLNLLIVLLLSLSLLTGCEDTTSTSDNAPKVEVSKEDSSAKQELAKTDSSDSEESEQVTPATTDANKASSGNNTPTNNVTNNDSTSSPVALLSATVTRVVDGDTAYVKLSGGKEEKVRFIGVDTPESTNKKEPYGAEASAYTKSKLDGKTIYLELDAGERDRYGRLLAYIWLSKPTKISDSEIRAKMFNAKLLTDGYAQVMTIQPNSKYADKFVVYQGEARNNDLGLWALNTSSNSGSSGSSGGTSSGSSGGSSSGSTTVSTPSPTPAPSENNSLTVYVTNTGSKYHVDGCRYLSKSQIPISLNEAKASYDPCSVCDPPR